MGCKTKPTKENVNIEEEAEEAPRKVAGTITVEGTEYEKPHCFGDFNPNDPTCQEDAIKEACKLEEAKVVVKDLSDDKFEETGMVQYFYHSPLSEFPVRDVSNELGNGYKTEPHIEIGAENYIACCYQDNIKKLAASNGKYLFLITTCRNKDKNKELNRKRGKKETNQLIVGYIEMKSSGIIDEHTFVRGPTKIYSFENSVRVKDIFLKNFSRVRNKKTLSLRYDAFVDEEKTKKIIDLFPKQETENILNECIREIILLEENNEEYKTCRVLNGNSCMFKDKGCLRWSLP